MALSRVISEIFNVEKCRDLEIGVRGHSRSLKGCVPKLPWMLDQSNRSNLCARPFLNDIRAIRFSSDFHPSKYCDESATPTCLLFARYLLKWKISE